MLISFHCRNLALLLLLLLAKKVSAQRYRKIYDEWCTFNHNQQFVIVFI